MTGRLKDGKSVPDSVLRDRMAQRLGTDYGNVRASDEVIEKGTQITTLCHGLAGALNGKCPPSRELSIALTKIEEATYWAIKSIFVKCDE